MSSVSRSSVRDYSFDVCERPFASPDAIQKGNREILSKSHQQHKRRN